MNAPAYIDTIEYLDRRYERRFSQRVRHAIIIAGNITWADLARAMTEHTGRHYSRDMVVNLAGRLEKGNSRSRVTMQKVDDIVDTFAEGFQLRYARKDGSPGRPVDRDWFLGELMPTLVCASETFRGSSTAPRVSRVIDLAHIIVTPSAAPAMA